jgi:hypothetical protein
MCRPNSGTLRISKSEVGPSALTSFLPPEWQLGKQRELTEAKAALAPGLVPIIAPNARGVNPELLKVAQHALPGGFESPSWRPTSSLKSRN